MVSSFNTFSLFEKIASEPISSVNFPSHFEIVLKLKTALSNPTTNIKKVVSIIHCEPLIASKIMGSSNSVVMHGYEEVTDLETAVRRLGVDHVRRIALVTALNQLKESKCVLQYASLARRVWLCSLYVAAASAVIAEETTEIVKPDAQFTGLLLKLGAFYLLHRLGSIPDLILHPDDVKEGLSHHYLDMTRKVLTHLGLPKMIIQGTEIEAYENQPVRHPPKTVAEVIYIANLFTNDKISWFEEDAHAVDILEPYRVLEDKIEAYVAVLQTEYR